MNCGKCGRPLSYNETGLNRKFNANAAPLCLTCLAEKLEVPAARLREKIGEYLAAGCMMFVKEE